ncbi:MAG: SDR family NAD(P)-dependent oxidoreductase [Planctomycetia bacterium]|nr:SDR family NAD(P)-dependent oxidoreductase [Planctomycetia bacterium]
MRHTIPGSRVILTGASSGIGRQLALQLGTGGAKLVINARRGTLLEEVRQEIQEANDRAGKPTFVELVVGDITLPQTRQTLVDRVVEAYGGLDILLNNAGGAASGLFETGTPERLTKVLNLNLVSAVEMTRLALPWLKCGERRKDAPTAPMIVYLSSVVGFRGVTHYSEYCAAKFAVRGFSESIRTELHRYGIDVLCVCPGSTDTEFFTRYLENTGEPTWPHHSRVSPQYVAGQILRAIRRGKHEITPFFLGKVLRFLNNFCPRFIDRAMLWYAEGK